MYCGWRSLRSRSQHKLAWEPVCSTHHWLSTLTSYAFANSTHSGPFIRFAQLGKYNTQSEPDINDMEIIVIQCHRSFQWKWIIEHTNILITTWWKYRCSNSKISISIPFQLMTNKWHLHQDKVIARSWTVFIQLSQNFGCQLYGWFLFRLCECVYFSFNN